MAFERILVALDGSPLSEESLVHAIGLAKVYHSALYLLRVLDASGSFQDHPSDDVAWRLLKAEAAEYLNTIVKSIDGDLNIECHVTEGRAPDQIVEFVRSHRIDLVVLTAWGWGGQSEFPFGGTVQKLVADPETSIMMVRSKEPGQQPAKQYYGRILVPLDGSQRATWALSLLSGMASHAEKPELILLEVVEFPDMPRIRPLTQEEAELRTKFVECNRRAAVSYLESIRRHFADGLNIRARLEVSPHIVETIHRIAEEESVDLIALTAHGASGDHGVAGTICQNVLRFSSRPVLVLQERSDNRHTQAEPAEFDYEDRKLYAH